MDIFKSITTKKLIWWCGCEIKFRDPAANNESGEEWNWEQDGFNQHKIIKTDTQRLFVCHIKRKYKIEKYQEVV